MNLIERYFCRHRQGYCGVKFTKANWETKDFHVGTVAAGLETEQEEKELLSVLREGRLVGSKELASVTTDGALATRRLITMNMRFQM